jgi:hypothetical protein
MYKNLKGVAANGIHESGHNYGGQITMYVGGTFASASVEVGFTHPNGKLDFYPIPDATAFTDDFIETIYFAAGMIPAIQITGATASTDLEVFINKG